MVLFLAFLSCSFGGRQWPNEEEEVTIYQQTNLPPLFPLEESQHIHTGDTNQVTAATGRGSNVAVGAQSDMAFSSPLVRSWIRRRWYLVCSG